MRFVHIKQRKQHSLKNIHTHTHNRRLSRHINSKRPSPIHQSLRIILKVKVTTNLSFTARPPPKEKIEHQNQISKEYAKRMGVRFKILWHCRLRCWSGFTTDTRGCTRCISKISRNLYLIIGGPIGGEKTTTYDSGEGTVSSLVHYSTWDPSTISLCGIKTRAFSRAIFFCFGHFHWCYSLGY